MKENLQDADPVRRWAHPDDFDGAMAQRDRARREVKKYKRLANELAAALRDLMPHPTDAAASCYDRQRSALARYEAAHIDGEDA